MKAAVYIGKHSPESVLRLERMYEDLRNGGCSLYELKDGDKLCADTDMILSVGGDGTFLSVAHLVADSGVPVVGVNLGRVGFLSENRPEDVASAILNCDYTIEDRSLLEAVLDDTGSSIYALNEVAVHRSGAAMLGVDVLLDGVQLPTFWADGLVVSTSSGSTAYSLSVGGPIVLPGTKALIIAPIAPHNLNVRPLVVPDTSVIRLKMHSRDGSCAFTADNRTGEVPEGTEVSLRMAQFSLKRVRLNKSNFINALTEKLYWGEDLRNSIDGEDD